MAQGLNAVNGAASRSTSLADPAFERHRRSRPRIVAGLLRVGAPWRLAATASRSPPASMTA